MKPAAAFKGCYADWKLIKTRACVQVVLEIPLHEADAAYQALGGMPDPAAERWFGIARLDLSNVAGVPATSATRGADSDLGDPSVAAPRLRKPVAPDKRLAQQAGIVCSDPMFWRYVEQRLRESGHRNASVTCNDLAASYVRWYCQVASRSEIKIGTPEGELWEELHSDFIIWRDAPDLAPDPRVNDCQAERV